MAPLPRSTFLSYNRQVRRLADELAAGDITVDEWHDAMERLIGGIHIAAYLAGQDAKSQDDLSEEAAALLLAVLAFQLGKLREWANQLRQVASGIVTTGQRLITGIQQGAKVDVRLLTPKALYDRAVLYALTADATYQKAQTDKRGMPRLPAYSKDGQSDCMHNCYCFWRIDQVGPSDWDCTWIYNPLQDNCKHCPRRARVWNPLKIRGGIIQPYDATGLFRGIRIAL